MINIFVTINVTADKRAKVLELLAELTAASQKENGNLRYQYYLHPTDPAQNGGKTPPYWLRTKRPNTSPHCCRKSATWLRRSISTSFNSRTALALPTYTNTDSFPDGGEIIPARTFLSTKHFESGFHTFTEILHKEIRQ